MSKLCQYKWEEYENRKMKDRLKRVKGHVDTSAPRAIPHLFNKKKKEMAAEERYSRIERENRMLLQKMSYIMTHNTIDNKQKLRPRSLNNTGRKLEMERIMRENQLLLKRIQTKKPFMSRKNWERHAKNHKERLRNRRPADPKKVFAKTKPKRKGSAKGRTGKLNPLDHGGFKNKTKKQSAKKTAEKKSREKAAENVIYKEGRFIDEQYVIVTVIENLKERIFSFRTYALETSHQNRVDVPSMTIRNCVEDDSLMRAEKHDELAMALIPRLRFINQKLVFDTKSQHSEAREKSQVYAKRTKAKLTGEAIKEEDEKTKKNIDELDKEANEKLEKKIAFSKRDEIAKKKAEEKAAALKKKAEEEEKARLIREKENAEADAAIAAAKKYNEENGD